MSRTRGLVLVLLAACASAVPSFTACMSSSSPAPAAEEPAQDASDEWDGVIPCGPTMLSKGPWSLAIDATRAKIRWESCRPGSNPTVVFAPESGGAEQRVDAPDIPKVVSVTSFATLDRKVPPDYKGTWYMHEAALSGLAPATCYAYRLLADPTAKGRFCTARRSGDGFRFMAIGDTNPALGRTKYVLDRNLPANPDFVIHGGDIQYYASTLETWALWFPIMAPMLRQGGFFPAIGNHESENPQEYEEYTLRFFGGAGFDQPSPGYYRFESGGVWFFSVDTQDKWSAQSDQGKWLAASLADAASKPGFRFSVVYFHRPLVTCGDMPDNPGTRAQFEPIFLANKVLLVFQAHMHGYERFEFPGITYVTTAGGGGLITDVDANKFRTYCDKRVAAGPYYHATIVEVDPAAAPRLDGGVEGGADAAAPRDAGPDAGARDAGPSGPMYRVKVTDDDGNVRDEFSHVIP